MADDTPDSRPNIFPELIYNDASAALEWLTRVFGFTRGELIAGPAGTIAHAEMHFGAGTIMLKSPVSQSEFGMSPSDFGMSPRALGGINQSLYIALDDADAHFEHAKAAGAEILIEPMNTDFGARMYVTRDVEGHLWSFGNYRPSREGNTRIHDDG